MIPIFDVFFSVLGLTVAFTPLALLALIGLFDTGSPLFLQKLVGRRKKLFTLIIFRTMRLGTASVATHLAQ